ncbi:MAG TPA: T9SS type A sorting domain-containing protein [Chitinophagaceae bacterium]|nr:T9SS type A sorting domain-containing protein [Chitinophagaceae bacterium]
MNRKFLGAALLVVALGAMAAGTPKSSPISNSDSSSLKEIKEAVVPVKKSRVRLYPNPTSDGNLSIFSNTSSDKIHFYVFDLEGTMVHQLMIKNKQRHKIKNLKKGTYVYDVFVNDTSIEQGKIIVK